MCRAVIVGLVVAASAGVLAQRPQESETREAAEALDDLIARHRHELKIVDGRLAGPGGDWLVEAADRAHFFMVGEQHATADIARLATAMVRSFRPLGYQRAAVEVGPWSTPVMEAMLRDGDALERYLAGEGRALTFPFFFFTEEIEFGRTLVELSDLDADALWGLDQEFIAAAPVLLDLLAEWADDDVTRAAVARAREQAAADPMWLGGADDAQIRALAAAFATRRDHRARRLIDAIVLSRSIYAPFVGRGGSVWEANRARERYMKRNFQMQLVAAETAGMTPKVFLKFGANHVFDGRSPTHVLSLGNFVREIAWSRGLEAVNVHVDCRGGRMRDPRSADAVPCTSYLLDADSSIASHLSDEGAVLIDLRALRPHARLWQDFDQKSQKLIWSFDAYIAIPDVAPATIVAAP